MNKTRDPVNPFKDIRERANLSQQKLADRIKVSKHAILRLEQGMYVEPLPTVINYFERYFNVSRLSLVQSYEQFQIETRANNARLLGNLVIDFPVGVHPLVYLRSKVNLNPTSLAKALCINQVVVAYFEKNTVNQHTVPEQLVTALHDADYTEDETNWFKDAYTKYRNGVIGKQDLKVVPLTSNGGHNAAV